jgi:hypothetical protein
MPLLDHFRPPLAPRRHWDSFHSAWAGAIADLLNEKLLPADYFAEEVTQGGARVEIDVATFHDLSPGGQPKDGAVAVAPAWSPPLPAITMPAVFPAVYGVRVFSTKTGGASLVAAFDLVSPDNKDRPETRRAFVTKCANYLYQGIGLIVVDIVTTRQANLHNELMDWMHPGADFSMDEEVSLYAVAYRPIKRDSEQIDVWPEKLALAGELPVLPLALDAQLCLPIDLETTYNEVCRRRRLQ